MIKIGIILASWEGDHHCGASGHRRGSIHDPFIHQEWRSRAPQQGKPDLEAASGVITARFPAPTTNDASYQAMEWRRGGTVVVAM